MKRQIISFFISSLTTICYGQSDTIFSNNGTILCSVKEITPELVKYAYQGEDMTNSIYKNSVKKIAFKNGRTQTFPESTLFKPVSSLYDFDNVTICRVESEVHGLAKIGEVDSRARGATNFSREEKIKNKAYKRIKINAAMQGANVVLITDQHVEAARYSRYHSSSAHTDLTGIGYATQLPDPEKFRKAVADKTDFTAIQETRLFSNADDYAEIPIRKSFKINKITNENGLIMLDGVLEGVAKLFAFRVVSQSESRFNIFYEDRGTSYNIMISL
jgi:hypothetical protein